MFIYKVRESWMYGLPTDLSSISLDPLFDNNLICLYIKLIIYVSHLCLLLELRFSYDHGQLKPIMSWMSLKKVLKCLLSGSPLLETLSLVSLPCPLSCVLQDVLSTVDMDLDLDVDYTDMPTLPLRRLRHIDLQRTDVKIATVESLLLQCKRLKIIDVSCCWQISRLEYLSCASISKAKLVWS